MPNSGQKIRLSVQTKVLIAVLSFLVLLPAITVWIVDRHISQQVRTEGQQTLTTAEAVFKQALDTRLRDLQSRFRNTVNESSYRLVLTLAEANTPTAKNTIRRFLNERIDELGDDYEAIFFVNEAASAPLGARRGGAAGLDDFARATASITALALQGEVARGTINLEGRVFGVVAVPVTLPETGHRVGVLTVGLCFTDAMVRELKTLKHTEVLLIADHQVSVSTLSHSRLPASLLREITRSAGGKPLELSPPSDLEINGEHFVALAGTYDLSGPSRGFRYLLLSSFEERLQALEATRKTLLEVSIVGILLSATVVGLIIRRITQPLRELRDGAEAVGRGDFSRRIQRFSNDECGDLAQAFNRMTSNLQNSRAELEKTVETLKATQAQLIQSEKLSAVGQFVAGVAHELNNPLTTVIGFSDLLRQTETDEKNRHYLDLVAKSAHRCHKIVHSLLSFARQHPPERKLVDVNALIEDVMEIMTYDLRTSNVRIVKKFQPDVPTILADAHQLQQVIINILSNARQAIEPFRRDGEITVRTRAAGESVRIEFQDNGPGIRPENLLRIFDPFFTTKPVGKGTGLGLSLSYGIIREHGGKITAQSRLGEGAEFVIELPAAHETLAERPALAPPSSRNPFPPVASGKSVLVIDDEQWILQLAQELLARDGHGVEVAVSGEKAIEVLKTRTFDVIISDWKMPGLNGMHLFEHLLDANPVAAQRMLFMTGDVVNDSFQDFLRRHEKTCLSKPFSIDEFRVAVGKMATSAN